jgi:prepilin-type N-terminal cleavage/methylation domain-containing protein
MTKRFGFTLAEVLITLGIIGVVAAMTIPTLMNQTGQSEFKSGFKKAVSVLNQAIAMNVALENSDFGMLSSGTEGITGDNTDPQSILNALNERMNVIRIVDDANADLGGAFDETGNYTIFLNDGMAITFPQDAASCTEAGQDDCTMIIDVNGTRNPNRLSNKTTHDTNTGTGDNIYDQFVVDFFNQQVIPHDDKARFALYE